MPKKTRISALFLDFDGTISSINTPTEKPHLTSEIKQDLQKIAGRIPIAVITTKDMRFVQPQVPFAQAWAAIGGLEIKIGNREWVAPQAADGHLLVDTLSNQIEDAAERIDDNIYVEKKRLSNGNVVAFCVDWRLGRDWKKIRACIDPLMETCKQRGFRVLRYAGRPYIDVYPCEIDKGRALSFLRDELKIDGPVMYMGDSELDNSAFRLADISVGVLHEGAPTELECEFYVQFDHVKEFLGELWANHLTFSPDFQSITEHESPSRA